MADYIPTVKGFSVQDGYRPNLTKEKMDGILSKSLEQVKPVKNYNPFFNDKLSTISGLLNSGAMALQFGQELDEEIRSYNDMSFKAAETEINGVPSYGGISNLRQQYKAINDEEAGKGLIAKGGFSGASAGASLGSVIPGLGTVAGGLIGGAVGLATGIFGKKKAGDAATQAKQRANEALEIGQNKYNEDVETYYDQVDQRRIEAQSARRYNQRLYGTNITDPFATVL